MRHGTIIAMAMGLSLGFAARLAQAGPANNYLAESARSVAGGRSVVVVLAQAEIKSNIVDSKVAMAAGGGLLMALIDAGVNSARAKKAEEAILPMRTSLMGFDADALALSTTDKAVAALDWFGAKPASLTKDVSPAARLAALDAAATPQTAYFQYDYGASPDLAAVVVTATIQIAPHDVPAGKKPDDRLAPKFSVFTQTVRSVVVLPDAAKEPGPNAQRWAADNAALARQALTEGFAEVQALATRALLVSAEDLDKWKKTKSSSSAGGHSGKLVEQNDAGTLLFDGTLINVHTLPAK